MNLVLINNWIRQRYNYKRHRCESEMYVNLCSNLETCSGGRPASVASLASICRSTSSSQTLDQNSMPWRATSSCSALMASRVIANNAWTIISKVLVISEAYLVRIPGLITFRIWVPKKSTVSLSIKLSLCLGTTWKILYIYYNRQILWVQIKKIISWFSIILEKRQGCNLVTDFQSLKNKNRTQNGKHRTSFIISLKNAL